MIDEKTQQLLLDYMDGKLDEVASEEVKAMLASDGELRTWAEQMRQVSGSLMQATEWKPSSALRESFNAALQQELEAQKKVKQLFLNATIYRVAASVVLLMVAGGIGFWYVDRQAKDAELLALRQEMEATRKMVFALLDNNESASQRLMGVKAAYETPKHDDAIVQALVRVMNEDDNANVRLSAIEALGRFSNESLVRKALVESLSNQTDPVVQLALIQVLVQIKEKDALKSLQKMSEDDAVLPSVRDEAYAGIIKINV